MPERASLARRVAGRLRRWFAAGAAPAPPEPGAPVPDARAKRRALRRVREVNAMRAAFAPLSDLVPEAVAENAESLFAACQGLIPLFHPPALDAQRRTGYARLLRVTAPGPGRERLVRLLAESDIAAGIITSQYVRDCPELWAQVAPQVAVFEERYGAPVFTHRWRSYSRGRTLVHYFSAHRSLLAGRRILHVAPEAEVAAWATGAGLDYATLDLGGDVDFEEDLTALDLADATFDIIVCHRVLEHVFDDGAALREMRRILRPGGVLNVSVPESMQIEARVDFGIQDESHHWHYRQYGGSFPAELTAAGFDPEVVGWALQQPAEALEAAGAYPLRMYNAWKRGAAAGAGGTGP